MTRLAGKTVVVTGAARGLGRAVALGLGREGATLWLCDRSQAELAHTVAMIEEDGGTAHSRNVDLSDVAECRRFAAEAGEADTLVNNAAVLHLTPVQDVTESEWNETLAVNLTAPFVLAQRFLPRMRKDGGSIINMSSRAGIRGFARETAYCAAKFGIEGMTRALACDLEGEPVSVNTMTPGLRIKPTMMTDDEERAISPESRTWDDAAPLVPAFTFLALARGVPSGLRFDAEKLSRAVEEAKYELSRDRLEEIAE